MFSQFFDVVFNYLFALFRPYAHGQYLAYRRFIMSGHEAWCETLWKENDALKQEIKQIKNNYIDRIAEAHHENSLLKGTLQQLRDAEKEQSRCIAQLECELTQTVSLKGSLVQLKKRWLDFSIHQLNRAAYEGWSPVYDFYIEYQQEAIENLVLGNEAMLSQEDIAYIKKKTDYTENFEPISEYDEETGEMLSGIVIVTKIA